MRAAPHELVLTRLAPTVPDAEGRAGLAQVGAPATVQGRLEQLSTLRRTEQEEARQLVEDPEAVAHVDVGTLVAGAPVDLACQVERTGAPAQLAGAWEIGAVRYTPALLRLILRRPQKLRGR